MYLCRHNVLMISRRLVRIKTLQTLYSWKQSQEVPLTQFSKELFERLTQVHECYLFLLDFPYQLREVGEPASVLGRMEGDADNGVLAAGQGSGVIDSIPPAGEIVRQIMQEAHGVLEGWSNGDE